MAEEHIEARYQIDPELFVKQPHFLLRVSGMSMRDAGILDGDLLAVHRTSQARNGEIIVARIEDEVTVKRFKRERNRALVQLLPENPDFDIIEVDLRDENFSIEGLSVGVIRRGH